MSQIHDVIVSSDDVTQEEIQFEPSSIQPFLRL